MSLVDVSELFTDPEFMRDVALRRPTVHHANEGEAVASYGADVPFTASVQPATAKERESIGADVNKAEGERGSGRVNKFYSATELKTSDGEGSIADVVVVPDPDGGSFRIVATEPWGPHGYYKALGVEIIP